MENIESIESIEIIGPFNTGTTLIKKLLESSQCINKITQQQYAKLVFNLKKITNDFKVFHDCFIIVFLYTL